MSGETQTLALANKFFDALERGDSRAIGECYAPGMLIWNNVLQLDLTGQAHIAALEAHFFGRYLNRKYIDPRTDLMRGGFVRQQVLTASLDGQPIRMPLCLVCRVNNGLLIRIDEYLTLAAPAEIERANAAVAMKPNDAGKPERLGGEGVPHHVTIYDARPQREAQNIDATGFAFVHHHSDVAADPVEGSL